MSFKPKKCEGCKKDFVPGGPRQLLCDKCRAAGKAKPAMGGRPPARAVTAKGLVATLVSAAEQLGEARALACVEQATTEVLKRNMTIREALIKSRHENRKLREEIEVAAVGDGKLAADEG